MRSLIFLLCFGFLGLFMVGRATAQQPSWDVYVDSTSQGALGGQAMTIDAQGNVWALFLHNDSVSVSRFDGNSWTHYGSRDGLPAGYTYSIISDHSGNIWMSADSGIAEFKDGSWHSYRIEDKLSGIRTYRALAADSSGNIWVATFALIFISNVPGGTYDSTWNELYRFDGTTWTSFTPPYIYNWKGFDAIAFAPNGTLWGTGTEYVDSAQNVFQYGLMCLNGTTWQSFNIERGTGLTQQLIGNAGAKTFVGGTALHPDNTGVWISVGNNLGVNGFATGVYHFDGTVWDTIGLSGRKFTDLWIAPNGDKYFRSNVRNQFGNPINSGALVIVHSNGNLDSIPDNAMPFFPFYSIQFMPNGTPWMNAPWTNTGLGAWLETMTPSSAVNSTIASAKAEDIYPNPATISITVPNARGSMSIVDPLGRRVDAPRNGNSFDVSPLANGIYFVRDVAGLKKFAIER